LSRSVEDKSAQRDPVVRWRGHPEPVVVGVDRGGGRLRWRAQLKKGRDQFRDGVLGDGSMKDLVDTKVRVRGVGFFDFSHRQNGRSRTCVELHPVLDIEIVH